MGHVGDPHKLQPLICWIDAIARSQIRWHRVCNLEDVCSDLTLSILDVLLKPAYPPYISTLPNEKLRLFKYTDDFFNGDITHSGEVEFVCLWGIVPSNFIEWEWCKFLLLLLSAAVQDRSREKFIFPATGLELYIQADLQDMLDEILPSRFLPSNIVDIVSKHREREVRRAIHNAKLRNFWINILVNKYDGRALPSSKLHGMSEAEQQYAEEDPRQTPEGAECQSLQ